MEFHVSRLSRDRYQFDQSLFEFTGNVIFANFHAARMFAQKMNQQRDLVNFPEKAVKAGHINAMGLIDEILHILVAQYQREKNPRAMELALDWLEKKIGSAALNASLLAFTQEFPPLVVYRKETTAQDYLQGETKGTKNRAIVLEELILLWVSNQNPALDPFQELFDDNSLVKETAYTRLIQELKKFFETQPPFGPDNLPLIDVLRAPAIAHPYSLFEQLEYIRARWGDVIGKYLYRLLSSLDLIKEEEKLPFHGPGPVAIPVYDTTTFDLESENFSPDREWMPRLVLIAKNAFVWLDQLTKQYQYPITRLDQIPDTELDKLASSGFTGLWLIGVWERSQASARIKQLCGNPEAIASAYSLAGYDVAWDLGGEEAYRNLRDRAWQRGIRLASDMVPNHMGIDSNWVIEHPDWFLDLDYSPFPSYTFEGPDLSPNPGVGIYIEDHYFTRSDAAVVFKRVDYGSGNSRFIYHGNDGTTMPWNDTAQLNYLNPNVREAVIQTILGVARRFPIIRFDAAMTLAKRHYQRLWFPEPGSGGAIPTRAEHGMTKEQFDQTMPIEFWREVVERVAQETPDTLLLAEAFWLMEGYFVRTLGMHRVYNSAFMNMMRNEDNAGYRTLIKNTLEFEPEILKRYVNFMNNPDERTTVEQFGKGDKYFGICVLLATLPGLPMFGHGQIEGFSEKYGMEYRKAYWDETVDSSLVERHRREIFPLLHRRALFAEVENFRLYDFHTTGGWVNENVYAYSNRSGDQQSLVLCNNKIDQTEGWIKWSTSFKVKDSADPNKLSQDALASSLRISSNLNSFLIYRDQITNLEYISSSQEIHDKGLKIFLNGYRYYVFVDFREVQDDEYGSYHTLCSYLNGRGVPNIHEALQELLLAPVMHPLKEILNPGYMRFLIDSHAKSELPPHLLQEAADKMTALLEGISVLTGMDKNHEDILSALRYRLELVLSLKAPSSRISIPSHGLYQQALDLINRGLLESPERWYLLLAAIFLLELGKASGNSDHENQSLSWIEEWQIPRQLMDVGQVLGFNRDLIQRMPLSLNIIIAQQHWYERMSKFPTRRILQNELADLEVQRFLGVNRHKDILWFNQESLDEFLWWLMVLATLSSSNPTDRTSAATLERLLGSYEIITEIQQAEPISKFQVVRLLDALAADQTPINSSEKSAEIEDSEEN